MPAVRPEGNLSISNTHTTNRTLIIFYWLIDHSTRLKLHLEEQVLNPPGRLLALPVTAEPLVPKQAHPVWHVGVLAQRLRSLAGMLVASLPAP